MKVRLDKTKIKGIRVKIRQDKPYNTYVGHPFIAHDMSFKVPSESAEDAIANASRDFPLIGEHQQDEERRVIVRLPTSPVSRGRRPDILGDLVWLLGSEDEDIQNLFTSDRIKDKGRIFNQKLVYGVEPFAAKRWAIRLEDITMRSSTYEGTGVYESTSLISGEPIKAVWLDVHNMVVPEGCKMEFYIKIGNSAEPLRIYPRNMNYYGESSQQLNSPFLPPDTTPGSEEDKVIRYTFDPAKDIASHVRYIHKNEPVKSVQMIIKMKGPGDKTPTLDGYILHVET
jgi:hypothetical protein